MKTHKFNLKALILVLALTLTGQSFAHKHYSYADEKKVVKVNMKAPLIKFITSTLNVSSEDLDMLKEQLNDASFYIVNHDDFDIDSNSTGTFLVIEYNHESIPLEDWMFDENYLNSEAEPVIEDWMLDEDYLNSEAEPVIEDWMLDENYLNSESAPVIEDWMFDEDYLNSESEAAVESWMMDEEYYQ